MTTTDNYTLIRRLLEALVQHPRELIIDFKELEGRVDWKVRTHIDDQSALIGKDGCHIKAIQFLTMELGDRCDLDYHLRLMSPDRPARRNADRPFDPVKSYAVQEAGALLNDWLRALLREPPKVEVLFIAAPLPLTFTFKIQAITRVDQELLLAARENDVENRTVVAALGTLFRAYGYCQGVSFKIEVPE